jgi:hypothetical protein
LISKTTFSKKCLELYKEGLTFQEIGIKLGKSKSSVRTALFRKGVDVYPDVKIRNSQSKRTPDNWFGAAPYGFVVVRAKLERHPKEFATARMIIDLWQQGVKYEAIAQRLNELGVRPRKATKWERTTIRELIRRHQEWPDLYRLEVQ